MNQETQNEKAGGEFAAAHGLGDNISNLVTMKDWEMSLGISAATLSRWRCAGMFSTVNIKGRQYITREEIRAFEARAINGDYAEEHSGTKLKKSEKSPNDRISDPADKTP